MRLTMHRSVDASEGTRGSSSTGNPPSVDAAALQRVELPTLPMGPELHCLGTCSAKAIPDVTFNDKRTPPPTARYIKALHRDIRARVAGPRPVCVGCRRGSPCAVPQGVGGGGG